MATMAFTMESDISKLEAPTFTTIDRGQPEPMLALDWSHDVNLVGKKVVNPMIHCCEECEKPILIYGRMIPCKHVFCLACAKQQEKKCQRCGDKVTGVEQAAVGNIYLCTQGGTRYGNTGCRRTYLSNRDLQAHIHHRHMKPSKEEEKHADKKDFLSNEAIRNAVNNLSKANLAAAVAAASKSSTVATSAPFHPPSSNSSQTTASPSASHHHSQPPPYSHSNQIAVLSNRQSNLITVPIQQQHQQQLQQPPNDGHVAGAQAGAGSILATGSGQPPAAHLTGGPGGYASVQPPPQASVIPPPVSYATYQSPYPTAVGGVAATPVAPPFGQPPQRPQTFSQPPPAFAPYPAGGYQPTAFPSVTVGNSSATCYPAPAPQYASPAGGGPPPRSSAPPAAPNVYAPPPSTGGSTATASYPAPAPGPGASYSAAQWSRPPPTNPPPSYYRR